MPGLPPPTNAPTFLGIQDVVDGVLLRTSGALVRILDVRPLNLALADDDELAARLDLWQARLKEHPDPVDIRVSTRPQAATAYLAELDRRRARLAQARSLQERRLAALADAHARWLRESVLPASRERSIAWWPWVNPFAAAPPAGAALLEPRLRDGLQRLEDHVARVQALLDDLGLAHTLLDHAGVLRYLYLELHPRADPEAPLTPPRPLLLG